MEGPDIVGLYLDEAKEILASTGFSKINVDITVPPRERGTVMSTDMRVIRVQYGDEATLLVCRNIV